MVPRLYSPGLGGGLSGDFPPFLNGLKPGKPKYVQIKNQWNQIQLKKVHYLDLNLSNPAVFETPAETSNMHNQ